MHIRKYETFLSRTIQECTAQNPYMGPSKLNKEKYILTSKRLNKYQFFLLLTIRAA